MSWASVPELLQKREVVELYEELVERVNAGLAQFERIKRVAVVGVNFRLERPPASSERPSASSGRGEQVEPRSSTSSERPERVEGRGEGKPMMLSRRREIEDRFRPIVEQMYLPPRKGRRSQSSQ